MNDIKRLIDTIKVVWQNVTNGDYTPIERKNIKLIADLGYNAHVDKIESEIDDIDNDIDVNFDEYRKFLIFIRLIEDNTGYPVYYMADKIFYLKHALRSAKLKYNKAYLVLTNTN